VAFIFSRRVIPTATKTLDAPPPFGYPEPMQNHAEKAKKPEILSPAGSLEAFFAAMEKGADAVYAGLTEFSARAKARNFTLAGRAKGTLLANFLLLSCRDFFQN